MKILKKWLLTALIFSILCGGSAYGVETDMVTLEQKITELIKQNQQLTDRIAQMENRLDVGEPGQSEENKANTSLQEEEKEGQEQKINDFVTLSGTIEGEAVFGEDFEGNSLSEFNVATVELGFDAQMTEWVLGHILAIYEGGDEDELFIDEATIELGNYEKLPVVMTAGQFYMPFGTFETNLIQDPLTLAIGEISDAGVAIGVEQAGFFGAVYGYNGIGTTGNSDEINGFGLMAGYSLTIEDFSLETAVSWVSNIADSGGISDALDEKGVGTIEDEVSGVSVNLLAVYGSFSFIVEYTSALESFESTEISFEASGAKLMAWNLELGYSTEIVGKETIFAIGYQGTGESVELGLPKSRLAGAASFVIFNGTTISFEYFYDEDYDVFEGGTGETASTFTTQLAYEF